MKEYKRAMQEIHINTDDVRLKFENRIQRKTKREKIFEIIEFKKPIYVYGILLTLIIGLISINLSTDANVSNFTITAYASELNEKLTLSNEPITLSAFNQFNNLNITNDETGIITFDLNLKCEGESIKSITYRLADKNITRDNRNMAVAWFAENDSYNINSTEQYINDKSVYESYKYDNKYFVTKMIGSVYSVEYIDQNDKNYALAINLNKDHKGEYNAEKFTITVLITLDNGTVVEKHIFVKPIIADMPVIEITLIN
ncbi:hypothetical protein [Clostridium sp. DL1XJH146]